MQVEWVCYLCACLREIGTGHPSLPLHNRPRIMCSSPRKSFRGIGEGCTGTGSGDAVAGALSLCAEGFVGEPQTAGSELTRQPGSGSAPSPLQLSCVQALSKTAMVGQEV